MHDQQNTYFQYYCMTKGQAIEKSYLQMKALFLVTRAFNSDSI